MGLSFFLTAYDRSDLPGGSVDPLGFDRGYGFLADKILPGMTNVASNPRYFGVLAAGVLLAGVKDKDATRPAEKRERRVDAVLRLERCWALANVLHARSVYVDTSGLRGVTYAEDFLDLLDKEGGKNTDLKFKLSSNQAGYGVLGTYGRLAEDMGIIDRTFFDIRPLGQGLGEAFLDETRPSGSIKKVVSDREASVPLSDLEKWGKRAYILGKCGPGEKRHIKEMINQDPVRKRFFEALKETPRHDGDTELKHLARVREKLSPDKELDSKLRLRISVIEAYERCYALVLLAFERMLWLCRSSTLSQVPFDAALSDLVMKRVRDKLPPAVTKFDETLSAAEAGGFLDGATRLTDVRAFLLDAAAQCTESGAEGSVSVILHRHRDVQHGKFDGGIRKGPWIEETGGNLTLTGARTGGLPYEATSEDEITPHPYRLAAAYGWIREVG